MNTIKQTKYWMFTINNPQDWREPSTWAKAVYVVWQLEQGEEQATPHLQGYVIMTAKERLSGMKKVHPTAHWEPRAGTHAQAKAYVTKAETRVEGPWESGDEPEVEQGKRNDLLSLKRRLDEGATEAEIAQDDNLFPVWAKFGAKCISRYYMLTGRQRDWHTYCHVLWGPPGVGKSRKARDLAGPEAFWLARPAGQTAWFDGYIGQETVVIDEFYGWLSLDLLCRLLDRYPCNVETKGGSVSFVARRIFITSNMPPTQWYSKLPPQRTAALDRRLTGDCGKIEHMATNDLVVTNLPNNDDRAAESSSAARAPTDWIPVQPYEGEEYWESFWGNDGV